MCLIFQRGPNIIRNFSVNAFRYQLVDSLPDEDIFIYHITNGDFCMFFLGVDTSSSCGSCSNVDFVHSHLAKFRAILFKKCHYTAPFRRHTCQT